MKVPTEDLKEVAKVIQFCKSFNIEISKEMQGFLAGIQISGEIPKIVALDKYNELKSKFEDIDLKLADTIHERDYYKELYRQEKNKKKSLF